MKGGGRTGVGGGSGRRKRRDATKFYLKMGTEGILARGWGVEFGRGRLYSQRSTKRGLIFRRHSFPQWTRKWSKFCEILNLFASHSPRGDVQILHNNLRVQKLLQALVQAHAGLPHSINLHQFHWCTTQIHFINPAGWLNSLKRGEREVSAQRTFLSTVGRN